MPAGVSPGGAIPVSTDAGCYTPEGYSRLRKFASPNFRNATIDKLDGCNEVTIGVFATVGITIAIWMFAMPVFDMAGMPWMRGWEGSGMTMARWKRSMAEADLYSEFASVFMEVENLEQRSFAEDDMMRITLESVVKTRLEKEFGSVITTKAFDLDLSNRNNYFTSDQARRQLGAERRRLLPKSVLGMHIDVQTVRSQTPDFDTFELIGRLNENRELMAKNMEMDLTASQDIRNLASGALIVHIMGNWSLVVESGPGFASMDHDEDDLVHFSEFKNLTKSLRPYVNPEEARHAFAGLDENRDNVLQKLEFKAAMKDKRFFIWNSSGFTTTPEFKITTMKETTPAPRAPIIAARTTTTVTTTSVTEKPNFASIDLEVHVLRWRTLSQKERITFALAYRKDLAYASGVLSTDIMDVEGRRGCVTMGQGKDSHLWLSGCLQIPTGATVEDLKAVITSGTEVTKLVEDFTKIEHEREVEGGDIEVTVDTCPSCENRVYKDFIDKESESFCEWPKSTTTFMPQTTITTLVHSTTTRPKSPPKQMTMQEFIKRIGVSASEPASHVFSMLDNNGNEFTDPLEFEKVATDSQRLKRPLTNRESQEMFNWMDINRDGRIEALEFLDAYRQATPAPLPAVVEHGPITLSQWRDSIDHKVQYTKVGVGLCRTEKEAWPRSAEHPEGVTKDQCQALCAEDSECGAFAFKLGGVCRIYPSSQEYPDTTPMTDVECFAREASSEALFDLVLIKLLFTGHWSDSAAHNVDAQRTLARTISTELGIPSSSIKNSEGITGSCSLARAQGTAVEAICFLEQARGQRLEDVKAVIKADATSNKLASDLSAVNGLPHVKAENVHTTVEATSALFRIADTDGSGMVSRDELLQVGGKLEPVLNEDALEFAFRGLDYNSDGRVNPSEFEAEGMTDFFLAPRFV